MPRSALAATSVSGGKKRRLTFVESTELKALPDRIDVKERERETILASLNDPVVLRDGRAALAAHTRLTAVDHELAWLLERWEALETIAAESR